MTRTVHTWRILGEDLVGTCHVPTPGRAGGLSGAPSVGVLLLNAGSAPRSGNSDLSARIGDRLALRGFPVFRFDLAGLGDSSGPTPLDLDSYRGEVVEGRNDAAALALIERIRLEFGVARIVVGGLCAAVFPTLRTIDGAGDAAAGLVLLEPGLRLAAGSGLAKSRPSARTGPMPLRRALSLLGLARGNRIRRVAGHLRGSARGILRRLSGATLPLDANVPLILRWRASVAHGVHSLVVVAAGQETDHYVTRILETLPARAAGSVACVRVPGTNHLFTGGSGRDDVLDALERWMVETFGAAVPSTVRRKNGS